MKFLLCLSLLCFSVAFGQEKYTISGKITDAASGEEIIGASIRVIQLSGVGAIANEYGFYSLTLPQGNYDLVYSAIGLQNDTIAIELNQNLVLNHELGSAVQNVEAVEVSAVRKDENVRNAQMGVEVLDPQTLAKVPVIFGEKDIIKTMQLTPGIKSGGDGNAGFYVRGGTADQNLILLDEAPVYNASHLLGFFSTFNSDAIKNATIYKGTQPAQYGGRLASVLDIKMNEGNTKKFGVSGGLGLISSKLNVEGPIIKDKMSFLVSGRRTYADLFLKLSNDETLRDSKLFFYDLNAKLNYKIGEKDRLYLSGYFGRDKLGISSFGITWGNTTGTIRWNHIINSKLFSNTSFIVSNYIYDINISSNDIDITIGSVLQDYNLKQEFQYFANNRNKLRFGINAIHHGIVPGQITGSSNAINSQEIASKLSLENAAFISNEYAASEKLNIIYGVRLTAFSLLGNGAETYRFDENGEVTDTNVYSRNEIVKTYVNVEPRLSLSYVYSKTASIKAGYARNVQNVHLISNSTSGSPTDIWIPSSLNIRPEIADQVSLGWFRNFKDNKYELSIEGYYKDMQNQIDYKDAANTQANELLEGELRYGVGRAYGVEFYLKKTSGKFTGWVGYTLSKTERKIDGINNNEWYNARQDRTHDISVVGIYDFNDKLSLSATFVFYTGNAVTYPTGKYQLEGETYYLYSSRNADRFPAYHRSDIGLTWVNKKTEKFESSWNFSIYNWYGHENAYIITFEESETEPGKTDAIQTSLFKMIPSISYNFKF